MKSGDLQGFLFLGGMLALFFGALFLVPRGQVAQQIEQFSMESAALSATVTDGNVAVSYVTTESGFVTVHRAMGDAPGEVLGVKDVSPGEGVTTVTTGEALGPAIILLFVDDGDGLFEPGIDRPVVRDGASVRAKVTLSPAL